MVEKEVKAEQNAQKPSKPNFIQRGIEAAKRLLESLPQADQTQLSEAAEQVLTNEPSDEMLQTGVGTTYLSEVAGRTKNKVRSSYDGSALVAIDSGKGVAVVVCDGAGQSVGAHKITRRVIDRFVEASCELTAQMRHSDRTKQLIKACYLAVEDYLEDDLPSLPASDNDSACTITGYILTSESPAVKQLEGVHAGDSELHLISERAAVCLSARNHHREHQLIVAVTALSKEFLGQSLDETLRPGDVLLSFSDGFAKYWFEEAIFNFTKTEDIPDDIDQFKLEYEARKGKLYNQRMIELRQRILDLAAQGLNPATVLLAEAKTNAEVFAANAKVSKGYHDDITLAITIVD